MRGVDKSLTTLVSVLLLIVAVYYVFGVVKDVQSANFFMLLSLWFAIASLHTGGSDG